MEMQSYTSCNYHSLLAEIKQKNEAKPRLRFFCSTGEIRTRDQLVTRNLQFSLKRGLYHHPRHNPSLGKGRPGARRFPSTNVESTPARDSL
jgi:hypothetical protein